MPSSVRTLFHWLSALIALPAVAYAGQPFFRSAANALKVRRLNMDVPISLGVILATTMSLYQTIRGSEQVYFDAAITLLAFLLLGRLLDEQMRRRASSAAANLLGLSATAASVIGDDGAVSRIALRKIVPGMRVLAAAGERIAVDGVVATGVSEVDQSLITGESVPKSVRAGRQRIRRHRQHRPAVDRHRQPAGAADGAGRDRQADDGCRAGSRCLRQAGRPRRPAVCAGGARPRPLDIRRLDAGRRSLAGRAHRRHRRPHHHLPMCARTRRAGRTGRGGEQAVRQGDHPQGRRRSRASRRGRHRRARQDRHLDGRRTAPRQRRRRQ